MFIINRPTTPLQLFRPLTIYSGVISKSITDPDDIFEGEMFIINWQTTPLQIFSPLPIYSGVISKSVADPDNIFRGKLQAWMS